MTHTNTTHTTNKTTTKPRFFFFQITSVLGASEQDGEVRRPRRDRRPQRRRSAHRLRPRRRPHRTAGVCRGRSSCRGGSVGEIAAQTRSIQQIGEMSDPSTALPNFPQQARPVPRHGQAATHHRHGTDTAPTRHQEKSMGGGSRTGNAGALRCGGRRRKAELDGERGTG